MAMPLNKRKVTRELFDQVWKRLRKGQSCRSIADRYGLYLGVVENIAEGWIPEVCRPPVVYRCVCGSPLVDCLCVRCEAIRDQAAHGLSGDDGQESVGFALADAELERFRGVVIRQAPQSEPRKAKAADPWFGVFGIRFRTGRCSP